MNVVEADIAFPSFTTAHVCPVNFSLESERFLRQSARQPDFPQALAKRYSYILGILVCHKPKIVGCELKVHGL